jgi:uncharacterized protein YukE
VNGAHVDSQALREFAAQLKRFSEILSDDMARTQGQMSQLGESWRDPGYEEFRNAMAKSYPMLKQLVAEANSTVPKLNRDAEAVEEFAQLRPE